jgi:hypothetical protein
MARYQYDVTILGVDLGDSRRRGWRQRWALAPP